MAAVKSIIPKIWVGLSIVLLTLFLAYWNYSNFQIQKKQLRQSLDSQLQLAYHEIMDSVYIEEIIVMTKINGFDVDLGNNTMKVNGKTIEATSDSFHQKLKFVDLNERPEYRDSFQIITYGEDLNERASIKLKADSLRYVQIQSDNGHFASGDIVQSDQINLMIENMFSTKDDHKPKIISLFKNKLNTLNYPSKFEENKDTITGALTIEYKGERGYDANVSLQFSNLTSYLTKKILPSILFSLLLLGIVGLAFWSLLSNWGKQQKLIAIKNEFISNMTHELKTPISTVSVALEAIAGFDLKKEQDKTYEYVDISRHELNRLSLLVDKVLKMAAFDSATNEMHKVPIILDDSISRILQSMKLQVEEKSAIINYTNRSDNSEIIGDQIHISNVIYNILDNALKYSNDEPKIDVSVHGNDKNVIITITDNGKGIPSEYIDKIFDRFFRIPTSDRHNVKGHGLGLSYVKDVISKHNGEIKATNNPGAGTSFIMTLPKSNTHV